MFGPSQVIEVRPSSNLPLPFVLGCFFCSLFLVSGAVMQSLIHRNWPILQGMLQRTSYPWGGGSRGHGTPYLRISQRSWG
ncbi:hypothetical protein BDW71DRAFT_186389 [Aspergillus fruticulosus]